MSLSRSAQMHTICKNLLYIILVFFISISTFSQTEPKPPPPRNMSEAILALEKICNSESRDIIKNTERDALSVFHMGLGMGLRNEWRLWHDSELALWFNRNGIYHADDMSSLTIDMFWKYLNGHQLSFKESVLYAKERHDVISKQIDASGVFRPDAVIIPPINPDNVKDDIIILYK